MINHKGTIEIETSRLRLRQFTPHDLESMYANCWQDEEVWQWTSYEGMDKIEDAVEKSGLFTDWWLNAYQSPKRYNWAIALKDSDQAIGRIFGMNLDEQTGELEISYELGKAWWNKGLMTEALFSICAFLIEEVGFNRLYAYHAKENPASARVLQKIGMTFKGIRPNAYQCNAGVFDAYDYELRKEQ